MCEISSSAREKSFFNLEKMTAACSVFIYLS
jgi:hypothetical protein